MSLYGALFSGVSGLVAQSSAMGAISDNITNVSTVGYKSTEVHFQTLVTKQTSGTFYSAGGVQSKPRQSTDVQGLLQSSTSQTDVAISGDGFFVVNSSNSPGISDEYLYTRSGSFYQDDQGFLKNSQGFYLQGWPTDASGTVVPSNNTLTVTNQNIISTDYMESINLNRVGGTAAATNTVAIGANLPSSDTVGTSHKTDVQFFNSLGNANNVSINYVKTATGNQWDLGIDPPAGTAVATLYDGATTPLVYDSRGQVEFTAIPAAGTSISINGQAYTFSAAATSTGALTTNNNIEVGGTRTLAQVVSDVVARVQAVDGSFNTTAQSDRIAVKDGNTSAIVFKEGGMGSILVDMAATLNATGGAVTKQTGSFTVKQQDNKYSDYTALKFPQTPAALDKMTINGVVYEFGVAATVFTVPAAQQVIMPNASSTTAADIGTTMTNLKAAIVASDTVLALGNRVQTLTTGSTGEDFNTLYLQTVQNDTNDVDFAAITAASRPTYGSSGSFGSATTVSVSTTAGLIFNADGVPAEINGVSLEILGFVDGAQNMNDSATEGKRITLDFGTIGEANGMTQFGDAFTPTFITQNGSKFGTFAGVTISPDGLVTALFDNGETRKIFKIPMATFVNPNQLESKSGNVWSATQFSGDYTLREPDSGPAGQVIQSSLEASTVDIGAEFTNMIVVQRAYSASTKIISTADQMLEELMRVKR